MKIMLLLLTFFLLNYSFSQETSELTFSFSGAFDLSMENDPVVDFNRVEVFSTGFSLKVGEQVVRTYQIISRNPKTGYELHQSYPATEEIEANKLVVYPILDGNRLTVQVYSSSGYRVLHFSRTN
jgi:hypothetical protein